MQCFSHIRFVATCETFESRFLCRGLWRLGELSTAVTYGQIAVHTTETQFTGTNNTMLLTFKVKINFLPHSKFGPLYLLTIHGHTISYKATRSKNNVIKKLKNHSIDICLQGLRKHTKNYVSTDGFMADNPKENPTTTVTCLLTDLICLVSTYTEQKPTSEVTCMIGMIRWACFSFSFQCLCDYHTAALMKWYVKYRPQRYWICPTVVFKRRFLDSRRAFSHFKIPEIEVCLTFYNI
jgi:hypothetical protein